jgi:serine protease Do
VVDDLLTHGSLRTPWIGVFLQSTKSNNPRDVLAQGAVVARVTPDSPADKAGIKVGDVIMREGDRVVHNPFDWNAALLDLHVGSAAHLHIKRGSREMDVDVNIADVPELNAPKVQVLRDLQLVTVTPQIAAERGLRRQAGALIYDITQNASDQTGLQKGDVIIQINRLSVSSAQDVARVINAIGGRSYLSVVVERQGQYLVSQFGVR